MEQCDLLLLLVHFEDNANTYMNKVRNTTSKIHVAAIFVSCSFYFQNTLLLCMEREHERFQNVTSLNLVPY